MTITAEPGAARSPGITYQELLDTDTHAVPDVLRLESPRFLGDADIPIDRYISRAWHEAEKAQLWSRVWQFACREEHIPNVGDHIVYEINNLSFVVVRAEPDTIKAYVNSCLHRGRRLKDYTGSCTELRCPYHGFAWRLDGTLQDIPADWDFPHVWARADEFVLPEATVATWAGFVFINPDPNAGPFAEFLGGMADHFERWDLADRYVQAHVAKLVRANWKITQEAFSESYHAQTTHPQTLPYLGDTNSQIDVWENYGRVITPGGIVSPVLDWQPSEREILEYMLDVRVDEDLFLPLKEGQTAREAAADSARQRWRESAGPIVDEWSDAEFIDNIDYTLFPNFHPWGAFNRIVYRFRPWNDDHRTALMEVFFLSPFSGERPPPAETTWLDADQPWTDAPELGLLAKVFQQDTFNMHRVQLGLEATRKPGITLANYQESKVRWFHNMLTEWVEG